MKYLLIFLLVGLFFIAKWDKHQLMNSLVCAEEKAELLVREGGFTFNMNRTAVNEKVIFIIGEKEYTYTAHELANLIEKEEEKK